MDALIEIKNLRKSFGKNHVLKGVSLRLRKGHNIVILGKSGIGKSVLTKCIMGLIEPDEGEIIIFGNKMGSIDDTELDKLRQKIGYLFQGGALYDSMTVRENLKFPLRRSRRVIGKSQLNDMIHEALENVGLLEAIDKYPGELSGGMRKRAGLARTLIVKPDVIFYDEPTTGLDPVTSGEIIDLMIDIQNKYQTSSIVITHDMKCAKLTGDEIKLLKDGVFYAEGSWDELKQSADKEVQMYFK